jgi:hypothetical protein
VSIRRVSIICRSTFTDSILISVNHLEPSINPFTHPLLPILISLALPPIYIHNPSASSADQKNSSSKRNPPGKRPTTSRLKCSKRRTRSEWNGDVCIIAWRYIIWIGNYCSSFGSYLSDAEMVDRWGIQKSYDMALLETHFYPWSITTEGVDL